MRYRIVILDGADAPGEAERGVVLVALDLARLRKRPMRALLFHCDLATSRQRRRRGTRARYSAPKRERGGEA